MIINCDFHIHSCLSPCGDLSMSPSYIAQILKTKNIQLAALTDHNSTLNCNAFAAACKKLGILMLYGMELQTQEEVHSLCLFADSSVANSFNEEIYSLMPEIMNNPEKMGDQVFVDENDDILGEVDKYLVTSADISIDDACKRVHNLGGLFIPAHVDRPAFSLVSQLGFIPEGNWDALEVTRIPPVVQGPAGGSPFPLETHDYPLTTSSDAHYPEHIARRPFTLEFLDSSIYNTDGIIDIEKIRGALQRRPRG